MAIALAILAAFCFASSSIFITRGRGSNSLVATMLLTTPAIVVVTGAGILIDAPDRITLTGILWFVGAGVFGDGIARTAFIHSINRIGPSTTTALHTGSYPALVLIAGVVIFSESVTGWRVAAAGLIVAGIWSVVSRSAGPGRPGVPSRPPIGPIYLLPVLAGTSWAVADVFRKSGMGRLPSPGFGAFVASITALAFWSLIAARTTGLRTTFREAERSWWLFLAGAVIGVGLTSVFAALDRGDISVVGPIIVSQPLIVVALSWALLKEHEMVTVRLALGAAATVLGVIVLGSTS